ncbi:MAG: alkylated DNA repair dioxygenase AlkB [Cellvibrionaceae bacterium]|jgi:alkylated DNA repair dioxygenase AlkB
MVEQKVLPLSCSNCRDTRADSGQVGGDQRCRIDIEDGELHYYRQWLDERESADYFQQLQQQVAWEQSTIFVYGKHIEIPRLNAWYGDPGCAYQYSGRRFEPLPWLSVLADLKERLEDTSGESFNSVLINCYRDGRDSVSWHSDDEPELGHNPAVASISLGTERIFQLRHKRNKTRNTLKLSLENGSLLVMAGSLQHHWQHQLPKTKKVSTTRINLTFRRVLPSTTSR